LSGAIALYCPPAFITAIDPPVLEIKNAKGGIKRRYNTASIVNEIENFTRIGYNVHVYIEDVHAMPGQGVTSMFSMGRGLGMYEGIVAALKLPVHFVAPQTWKKKLLTGMGKEKDASIYKAQQLFPTIATSFFTKRGRMLDGRAEALLIAYYGYLELTASSAAVS
jgi:crossover junction endodeoxyribonuclease RuvC